MHRQQPSQHIIFFLDYNIDMQTKFEQQRDHQPEDRSQRPRPASRQDSEPSGSPVLDRVWPSGIQILSAHRGPYLAEVEQLDRSQVSIPTI